MGSLTRITTLFLATATFAGPVGAQQVPITQDPLVVPGEVLIQLDTGDWTRITYEGKLHPLAAAAGWAQAPGVRRAQANFVYHPHRAPGDPRYGEQVVHQICEAEGAWDVTTGDSDVVVAIIGTGVDRGHPEIDDNMWTNPGETADNGIDDDGNGYVDDIYGWDFVDDDNDPYDPGDDHDTQVAGVLGAEADNGLGGAGIAWNTAMMPVRINFSSAQVAAAIDYAVDNGASVLNLSFGIFLPQVYGGDSVVGEALARAEASQVVVVASAGNDNTMTPAYPAANPTVIGVGATSNEDERAGFSNSGWWVDVAAPGVGLITAGGAGGSTEVTGTSFSCPYVAGLAALVRAVRPGWTAEEIRQAIELSGTRIATDRFVGLTRVNAQAAVTADGPPELFARIRFPEAGGVIGEPGCTVTGVALGDSYELAIKPADSSDWTSVATGAVDVLDGPIAQLSLAELDPGEYDLRLNVQAGAGTDTDQVRFIRGHAQLEGWPAGTFAQVRSSPTFGDLDGDGVAEVFVADTNHFVHGWDSTAAPLWFSPLWAAQRFLHTPALVDLDGDGDMEIVASAHASGTEVGGVYAWHHDATEVSGWPRTLGRIYGAPAIIDLYGDGDLRVVVAEDGEAESRAVVLNPDATFASGWPVSLQGHARTSPVVVDMDADGFSEIFVATSSHEYLLRADSSLAPGWPRVIDGIHAECAAADFDGDGLPEIVSVQQGWVELVGAGGIVAAGWPQALPTEAQARVVAGDMDGDLLPEVIATSGSSIHVWRHDGTALAGWPVTLAGTIQAAAAVADLDGDGGAEVIVPDSQGRLHAFGKDGTEIAGFPLRIDGASVSSPAVLDLDGDGQVELLLGGSDLRWQLWAFSPGIAYHPGRVAWSRSRHDAHNTAYHPRRFGLTARQAVAGQVHLDWEAPADVIEPAAYEVYRNGERVARVETPVVTDEPAYGGSYEYTVVAFGPAGDIRARSLPVAIEVEGEPQPDGGPDGGDEIKGGAGCGCQASQGPGRWGTTLIFILLLHRRKAGIA